MESWTGAVFAMSVCMLAGGGAIASGKLLITGFDADEIEVRIDQEYSVVAKQKLGDLPIEILEIDNRNFLRIKDRNGDMLWVSGGDVKTSDLESLRRNCSSLAMSRSGDRKQYGVRGVGDQCD